MNLIKKIFRYSQNLANKLQDDALGAYAAQAALYIILSFFPFLMFLLTLLRYLPFTQDQLITLIAGFIPDSVFSMMLPVIQEIYETPSGPVLSLTIIFALWAGSKGIMSFYLGLNSVYGIKETRNYLVIRLKSIIYTLVFCVMLISMLAVYVFGNSIVIWIEKHLPFEISQFAMLIKGVRTIVGICVLLLFFLIMYKHIPNRKSTLNAEFPGALLAAVGWVAFSFLYSFYINNLSNMTATYGSLTAIVLCIMWLFACTSIILFGAEVNTYWQKLTAKLKLKKNNRKIIKTSGYSSEADKETGDDNEITETPEAAEESPATDTVNISEDNSSEQK